MDKKSGILNPRLAGAIVGMGHFDKLVVADAGLPLPAGVEVLDLSLVAGVPGFEQVLSVVLGHLKADSAYLSAEMTDASPALHQRTVDMLAGMEVSHVSHDDFKALTRDAKLIVRTGECTPYANVILVAGVTF